MPKPAYTDLPDSHVSPDPKLERRSRRNFSPEYKIKIIGLADACSHGELGPLLRREGLYNGQLKQWREELATHGVEGLAKTQPGPKSAFTAEQKELEKLRTQVSRLTRELEIANGCLDLQKKALAMLDLTNNGKEQ